MNNTDGFKHFKLHSDNTLISLSKKELISYIHILHHNWQATDESYFNTMEYAKKLQDEVDKYKHEYYSMCDLFENPQPYKFEDLKDKMYVYDIKFDDIILVAYTTESTKKFEQKVYYWSFKDCSLRSIRFEENRFYPVQKANDVIDDE